MRLTAEEVAAIKAAARETFGDDVVVRLFGSRVHDHLKGGDIDLHLEVGDDQANIAYVARFRCDLFRHIEERKIDVVLASRDGASRPIDAVARSEGVRL